MMMSTPQYSYQQPPEIRTEHELKQLKPSFVRTISKELDVLGLTTRMCPVQFSDGSAGVFVLSQHYHDDQTGALLVLLKERGFRVNPTCLHVLSPTLLILVTKSTRALTMAPNNAMDISARVGPLALAMNAILLWALEHRASDIHFNVRRNHSDSAVMFTIDGRYVSPECYSSLPTITMLGMLSVTWMDIEGGNGAVFDPTIEQQGRFVRALNGQRLNVRWASLATDQGPSVCLRILKQDAACLTPELATLGYLDSQMTTMRRATLQHGGAIVLAGTVGSGKSTTLATLMREIPQYRKIITLEDPAEYFIPNALQNTVSRSSEDDALNIFDNKLRAFKRSAMNDLLIGEIRDASGGRAFTDLAGSGVSLYSTVHAGSALLIPERLASSFIGVPRDFLATPGILKLLVFQCLLPLLCQGCAQSYHEVTLLRSWCCAADIKRSAFWRDAWMFALEDQWGLTRSDLRFRSEVGCSRCINGIECLVGTAGRTVAAEFIEPSREPDFLLGIKNNDGLALHRWFEGRARADVRSSDMQGKSARESALYKVSQGLVDPREIERFFGVLDFKLKASYASV